MMQDETRLPVPRAFKALALGLLCVFSLLLSTLFNQSGVLSSKDILGLVAFFTLVVFGDSSSLDISVGKAKVGISGTIFLALVVLFVPFWASLCSFTTFLFLDVFIIKRSVFKAIFNATQVGLSTLLGALLFSAFYDSEAIQVTPLFLTAFFLAILTYWLFNTWSVSFAAYVLYGNKPVSFWSQNFQWTFIYELSSAPIALAVVYAYSRLWLIGLILIALPTLMTRLAYSQYLNLKKTYRETVRTLVKIIEMHDPYTAGHSDRVAIYSRGLCDALRLSPAKTEKIEMAAYLHDLGKIHLDLTGIVRKAGKLTEEERRMVRLHSVLSADLASQVSYFRGEIEEMIRHHHENWDGSGYPHGLKGEDIPLGARIILIADAFDAMTTSRVYRSALDLERVKGEFVKFSGIQFDPQLVRVFLDDCIRDEEDIIRQPLDEPLEGQRARTHDRLMGAEVAPISRRASR